MVNAWVEHVRKYAKEHNMSYMCAVEKAKESYVAPKKEKPETKRAMTERKEKEKIKLYSEKPEEYADLLRDLLNKIEKRESSRNRRLSKKEAAKEMEEEFKKKGVDINYLNKMSIQQLQERIEYIKKNQSKLPYPDLIHLELEPYIKELDSRYNLEKQKVKQKEKRKKEKTKKENQKLEKELKNIAF